MESQKYLRRGGCEIAVKCVFRPVFASFAALHETHAAGRSSLRSTPPYRGRQFASLEHHKSDIIESVPPTFTLPAHECIVSSISSDPR